MGKFDIKQLFIEMLDEVDVQQKLVGVVGKNSIEHQEIAELNETIKMLKEKNAELFQQNETISIENNDLKREHIKLTNQMNQCAKMIDVYEEYMELDQEIKDKYKNIICVDTIEGFVCAGMKWENIVCIWDVIKHEIDSHGRVEREEFRILNNVLDYYFNIFQKYHDDCIRYHVTVGDKYDDSIHCRAPGSETMGIVTAVLLEGFQYGEKRACSCVRIGDEV